MSFATLGGVAVTQLCAQISEWGFIWSEVELAEAVAKDEFDDVSNVALVIGDVEISSAIVDGGPSDGRSGYRLVGGRGGWQDVLPRRGYTNDTGVLASRIVADAAEEVSESIDVSGLSTIFGPHYARRAGPASAVLNVVAPRSWYQDLDGTIRFGKRATAVYEGDGVRTRIAPGSSIIEIETEEIATLLPGVTIDGSGPATDVEYLLDESGRFTVRVYAALSDGSSRRLDAWAKILDALDPNRRYRAAYEYRVATQSSDRFDVQPVRAASGMPDLARVRVRGQPGYKANVTLGQRVVVTFLGGDPGNPVVTSHDAWGLAAWMPQQILIADEPRLAAARQTDPVIAGGFAGTITLGTPLGRVLIGQ